MGHLLRLNNPPVGYSFAEHGQWRAPAVKGAFAPLRHHEPQRLVCLSPEVARWRLALLLRQIGEEKSARMPERGLLTRPVWVAGSFSSRIEDLMSLRPREERDFDYPLTASSVKLL
jgi:hypothetical protein